MEKTIIRNILKVFAFGGIAALISAIAIGLACCALWLFCFIPSTSGYFAVLLFGIAAIAAAAALYIVYICGAWIVGTGRYLR